MTHMVWNTNGGWRAADVVRPLAVLVFLVVVLGGFPAEMRAADERAGQSLLSASSTRSANDIETEARILRALRKDAQLGPLNLGVHVSSGVARLSGPVPTAELKKRVIALARQVDSVLTVNARDLYVSSADRVRKQLSLQIQDDRPTQTRAASPPLPSNGRGATPRNDITLLAPEMASPPARVSETARLTANPRPVSPAVALAAAIEQLRQREARYQQIRARVQGATVFVLPGDTAIEDSMRFAQAVRRLPGVEHVIVSSGSR
ncbi:MAG: BON domain-containing protein [Gemmataceae bacterium]